MRLVNRHARDYPQRSGGSGAMRSGRGRLESVGRGRAGAATVRVPHQRTHHHRQGALLLCQEQELSPKGQTTPADYEVRVRVQGLEDVVMVDVDNQRFWWMCCFLLLLLPILLLLLLLLLLLFFFFYPPPPSPPTPPPLPPTPPPPPSSCSSARR